MEYILRSEQYFDGEYKIKIVHNEKSIITIYIEHGNDNNIDFKSLGIDFSEDELHDLIGTLLHLKAKMRGGKNG
jgi:hypothetical protein